MSTAMLTGAGTSAELERRDCDEHKCGESLQFVHKMQVLMRKTMVIWENYVGW